LVVKVESANKLLKLLLVYRVATDLENWEYREISGKFKVLEISGNYQGNLAKFRENFHTNAAFAA